MKKLKLMHLSMIAVFSMIAFCTISCGSEDDDQVRTDSQRLVGKWKRVNNNSIYDTFGFLNMKNNGDCIRSTKMDFPEGNDTYDYYKWVYSEENKVLRIYNEGGKTFTFQVEFNSDGGWTGIRGNEVYIYQKLQ